MAGAGGAGRRGDRRGVLRRSPAVDVERHDVRACAAEGVIDRGVAGTVVLDRDPSVRHPLDEEQVGDLRGGLGLSDPVRAEPRCLQRALRLGPRATSREPASASSQPRKPTPVVTTRMSGGGATRSAVRRTSSSSSIRATAPSVGAWTTSAPRRASAAPSSSALRRAVTRTRQPVRTGVGGSSLTAARAGVAPGARRDPAPGGRRTVRDLVVRHRSEEPRPAARATIPPPTTASRCRLAR